MSLMVLVKDFFALTCKYSGQAIPFNSLRKKKVRTWRKSIYPNSPWCIRTFALFVEKKVLYGSSFYYLASLWWIYHKVQVHFVRQNNALSKWLWNSGGESTVQLAKVHSSSSSDVSIRFYIKVAQECVA